MLDFCGEHEIADGHQAEKVFSRDEKIVQDRRFRSRCDGLR